MDNKVIVIIGVIIVIAIFVALFLNFNVSKDEAMITMISNSSIKENSSIKLKLTTLNETPISNQTVNIKIIDENGTIDEYSVKTNEKGRAEVKLNKIKSGEYKVNFTYDGNDKYKSSNLSKEIKIEENVVDNPTSQQTKSSSSSNIHFDKELNVYYDDNGKIVDPDGKHPHGVGESYKKARETKKRMERGEPVRI